MLLDTAGPLRRRHEVDAYASFISVLDGKRVAVRYGASIDLVAWDDILCVKSANKYTCIVTTRRDYKARQSLATVVQSLAALGLVRIHRGIAINCARVEQVVGQGRHRLTIVLDTGAQFAVGREFQRSIRVRYGLRSREQAAHAVG